MTNPDLKACPACKYATVALGETDGAHQASCPACGVAGPLTHTKEGAVDGWNRLPRDHNPLPVDPAPTHRHVKRGTEYVLLGIGKMQAEDWFLHSYVDGDGWEVDEPWQSVDMREVAIYRSVDDGSLWARPREEFEDGRFEVLTPEGG